MRLYSFLLPVILYGVDVVGRERRYLEAHSFLLPVFFCGVYVVGHARRYDVASKKTESL